MTMKIEDSIFFLAPGGVRFAIVYGFTEKDERFAKIGTPIPMTSKKDNEEYIGELGAPVTVEQLLEVLQFMNPTL